MKSLNTAPALLVLGAVLLLVGLPLTWSAVATSDGARSIASTGLNYAGYDIATTAAFAVALVGSALALIGGWRWSRTVALMVALLACMWAALVFLAAGYPADGGSSVGVVVSVGAGVYVVAAGALLSLIGSLLGFRARGVAATRSGVQPSF